VDEDTRSRFCVQIDYIKYFRTTMKNLPLKGQKRLWSHDLILKFSTSTITSEQMKLRTSNFVHKWTISSSLVCQNLPPKGRGVNHVTRSENLTLYILRTVKDRKFIFGEHIEH